MGGTAKSRKKRRLLAQILVLFRKFGFTKSKSGLLKLVMPRSALVITNFNPTAEPPFRLHLHQRPGRNSLGPVRLG